MRVERETVTRYYCDYCSHEYSTAEEAHKCEVAHKREAADPNGSKPEYHTGDLVYCTQQRWYFILSEYWEPYWDTEKKCWMYRYQWDTHTNIPESDLRLVMPASEYNRRVQDIEDKLGGDYFVEIQPYNGRVGFRVDLEPKGEQK